MAAPEARVEQYLTQRVKALGGLCFKWTSPGRAGVPDRIVIVEGYVYFVEVKTAAGKLSPLQVRTLALLSKHGADTAVVYGRDDVDRFISVLERQLNE